MGYRRKELKATTVVFALQASTISMYRARFLIKGHV